MNYQPSWKDREQERLNDGLYKPVVWTGQDWFEKNQNQDHFLHVSLKDPTRIAFTKCERDGARDIQTAMKPGKYLAAHFKMLTPEQVRTHAMQHSTTFETTELKFATTPEDIQRVYEPSLGSSCFSGTTKANLYGSGDFAVAYIETDGKIKARVVCAPSRKIHARIYGDETRLNKLLQDSGYSNTGYYDEAKWRGLRLLKEHHWAGFYTDFGCRVGPDPTDPEKYLVLI